MPPRVCFRSVFIMTANFAIAKNPKMILPFETFQFSDAHDLVVVFPRNEMISKPLYVEIRQKAIGGPARGEGADHKRLPTLVMDNVKRKQQIVTKKIARRDGLPKDIFNPIPEAIR